MTIKMIKPYKLKSIQDDWKKLEYQTDMTEFQTYDWNKLLLEQFQKQIKRRFYRKVRYLILLDEKSVVRVIVPLRIKILVKKKKLIKEIELLGADSFSDYVNLIYPDDVTAEEFSKIVDYLKEKYVDYTIIWTSLPDESKFVNYLKGLYPEYTKNFYKTVVIPIGQFSSFDEYYSSLSKNTRQNYRTSCNRMERDKLQFTYEVFEGKIDNALMDTLLKINLERTIEKNPNRFTTKFSVIQEKINLKYNNIIRKMWRQNNSWTLVAYLNGVEVGFLTGIQNKQNIYVMMNKVKPEYEFYSPMIVSIVKFIEHLYCNDFCGKLDFGRGTESYKYKLGGVERNLLSLNIKL